MHYRIRHCLESICRLAAFWLMGISVVACSPTTPDPKPPLYSPIALTQIGSAAELEFSAYPKDSHEKNVLMIGLRVRRNWDGLDEQTANNLFRKIRVAKIKLKLTATQNGQPAQFKSYSNFDSPDEVQRPPALNMGSAEVQAYNFSHDGEYDIFFLAGLSRQEGGLYKVKVEVVEPNLDMEGMQAEVFVAFRLFGGK
jgi:hypothetical protein